MARPRPSTPCKDITVEATGSWRLIAGGLLRSPGGWVRSINSLEHLNKSNGSAQAEPNRHKFYNSANVLHALDPNF